MTCDCYSTVKEKLTTHIAESAPAGHGPIDVQVKGYLFGLSDEGVTHRSSNEVAYSYTAPKKTGGEKRVSKKTFVRAVFCPFCGLNYQTGKPAEQVAE